MLSRLVLPVLAALALAAPAAAQDETALIQKRQQVREMAREALASLYEVQPGARHGHRARGVAHAVGDQVLQGPGPALTGGDEHGRLDTKVPPVGKVQ
jgi:hypothetical protein